MAETSENREIKTLVYKTNDVEQYQPDPINVELGGRKYLARCPNDFEFVELMAQVKKLQIDPTDLALREVLAAYFELHVVTAIVRNLRGVDATIDLTRDLLPALQALTDHYEPAVTARMEAMAKTLKAPKK